MYALRVNFAENPAAHDERINAFRSGTHRLARTGRSVDVGPSETLVAALAKEGVGIPTSCESGICGTCITGVLDGVPDHRDDVLSASDRTSYRHVVPCVSRSKTPVLVLDL